MCRIRTIISGTLFTLAILAVLANLFPRYDPITGEPITRPGAVAFLTIMWMLVDRYLAKRCEKEQYVVIPPRLPPLHLLSRYPHLRHMYMAALEKLIKEKEKKDPKAAEMYRQLYQQLASLEESNSLR